jgi:hypothetical protein
LQSLDERFDFYLAQPEFIKPLSLLLYDEVFEVTIISSYSLTSMNFNFSSRYLSSLCHKRVKQSEFIYQFVYLLSYFVVDESQIREITVSLLGRLSTRNPAYVFPTLRAYLMDILREIGSIFF